MNVSVNARGQIVIPAEIRAKLHIEEGRTLELELTDEGILLRPIRPFRGVGAVDGRRQKDLSSYGGFKRR